MSSWSHFSDKEFLRKLGVKRREKKACILQALCHNLVPVASNSLLQFQQRGRTKLSNPDACMNNLFCKVGGQLRGLRLVAWLDEGTTSDPFMVNAVLLVVICVCWCEGVEMCWETMNEKPVSVHHHGHPRTGLLSHHVLRGYQVWDVFTKNEGNKWSTTDHYHLLLPWRWQT